MIVKSLEKCCLFSYYILGKLWEGSMSKIECNIHALILKINFNFNFNFNFEN